MTSSPYVLCYKTAANGIRGERTRLRRWPIKPVGCGNPDGAYELRIGTDRSLGTVTLLSLPRHRGHPVLPKLANFALCRLSQLLTQLGRSHAAKDLEILKENPRWATSASKENSNPSASASQQPRSAPHSTAAGSTLPRGRRAQPGARSCANRPQRSSTATSHRPHPIGLFARLTVLGRWSTSRNRSRSPRKIHC
jgi:hypothetical protein